MGHLTCIFIVVIVRDGSRGPCLMYIQSSKGGSKLIPLGYYNTKFSHVKFKIAQPVVIFVHTSWLKLYKGHIKTINHLILVV